MTLSTTSIDLFNNAVYLKMTIKCRLKWRNLCTGGHTHTLYLKMTRTQITKKKVMGTHAHLSQTNKTKTDKHQAAFCIWKYPYEMITESSEDKFSLTDDSIY